MPPAPEPERPPHGTYGRLDYDDVSGRLRCHWCDRWYVSIEQHARLAHGLSVSDYRAGAGLNRQTPLIAPALSQRRREVYGPIRDRLIAEGRMRRWDTDPDLWRRSKAAAVAAIREGVREEGVAKERGVRHHQRALTDAQRAELPSRYAAGATITELAACYETSAATIRREMQAAGITARPAGIRPGTKLGPRKLPSAE